MNSRRLMSNSSTPLGGGRLLHCGISIWRMSQMGLGCSLIPGVGQALYEYPCRVHGSLRGRGVPSA